METRGIITSAVRNRDTTEYTVFDGERYHRVTTQRRIKGKYVAIKGSELEELKEDVFEEVKSRFFRRVKPNFQLPSRLVFLEREMGRLWKELAFLKIIGEKALVYFDPDADGIVSLLLLMETVKVTFKPVTGKQLETGSGLSPDLGARIAVLLDTGSIPDTHTGVGFLSSILPVYVVDHHPSPVRPPATGVINPALVDAELSSYTTAILTSYLLSGWVKKEKWVRVAAAGDRSGVVEWSREDRKKALALELSVDVFGYSPKVWKRVLDGDLWKPLWNLFEKRMEMIDSISEKKEVDASGRRVLVVKYPSPGFYYPHRGKVASWYQEEGGYDAVIVLSADKEPLYTVTVRSSVPLLDVLEEVRERGIGEGWGHPNAVTFRTRDPEGLVGVLVKALSSDEENSR